MADRHLIGSNTPLKPERTIVSPARGSGREQNSENSNLLSLGCPCNISEMRCLFARLRESRCRRRNDEGLESVARK